MKRDRGITLIALVITIVVLIILAGVAISLSLGENGIFSKAKFASEEYANVQENEKIEIAKTANEIEEWVGGTRSDSEYHIERGSINITFPRSWTYQTIEFENEYTEIPEVYYEYQAGNTGGSVYVTDITTISFKIGYNSWFTSLRSDTIKWIAIGK